MYSLAKGGGIMFGKPELMGSFWGEYKSGVFSKKKMLSLYVFESYIDGTATMYFDRAFSEYKFNINFDGFFDSLINS